MPSFTGRTNRFVTYFCDTEDIKQAAFRSSLKLAAAKRLYKDPEIRAEIDRRLDKLHDYQAKLKAKAGRLTEDKCDAAVVKLLETEGGMVLLRTAELGYKKLKLIGDKVEHTGADGGPVVFTLQRIAGAKG